MNENKTAAPMGGESNSIKSCDSNVSSESADYNENTKAALKYAKLGYRVFPCGSNKKQNWKGKDENAWTARATSDPARIQEWFKPDDLIGLIVPEGAFVLDGDTLDTDAQTGDSVSKRLGGLWASMGLKPALSELVYSVTGGGGAHFWFRLPSSVEIGNGTGGLPKGFDVRAGGRGYIIAPPSLHASGRPYKWGEKSLPFCRVEDLPMIPQPLLDMVRTKRPIDRGSAPSVSMPAATPMGSSSPRLDAALNAACVCVCDASTGERNETLNRESYTVGGVGAAEGADEATIAAARARLKDAALSVGLTESEIEATLDSALTAGLAAPLYDTRIRNDESNSVRYVGRYGADFRFCSSLGWLHYDGRRWKRDEGGLAAREAAATIGAEIRGEANRIGDPKAATEAFKFGVKTGNAQAIANLLRLAEPKLRINAADLDRDPYALNCLNGTIDLRSRMPHPHRRDDLITRLTPLEHDPTATAPTWDRFLTEALPSLALREFIQRAVGYSATGDVSEDVLFFNHGGGSNGKSVFMQTILAALGEYSIAAPPKLVISSKAERHPTELACLHGARFVAVSETGEGQSFDEDKLKSLTGKDTIRARFMHRDFFEFEPTHKFWLSSNYRPRVRGSDLGIWRRIMLIPWTVTFGDDRKDPKLLEKLFTELPGVLTWIVRGAVQWAHGGLQPPAEVKAAVAEYRSAEDLVGRWLTERTERAADAATSATELYEDFVAHCRAIGEKDPPSQTTFGRRLDEFGFCKVPKARFVKRVGLRLVANETFDFSFE